MPTVSEKEAAIFLGITKELLYSFVKSGVKGKKLPINKSKKNEFFETEDLIKWNEFLYNPWSDSSANKPDIPLAIKEYLKVESEGKCARCSKGHRLDNAHIVPWSQSLSHHPHNLIRLCTDCHTKYDDGVISIEEIQILKQDKIQRIKNSIVNEGKPTKRSILDPPCIPGFFVGRETELNLLSHLFEKHRIILIEGVGGIGKTQLLLQFIKTEEIKVFWCNMEQYRSITDFQFYLIQQLEVNTFDELIEVVDQQQAVLVLDGFETLWLNERDNALNFLKRLFDQTSKAKYILTTQIDIADITMNPGILRLVKGLHERDSFEILHQCIPDLKWTEEKVSELIFFSEGHPLTLRLIGGLIRFMTEPRKVAQALEEVGVKVLKDLRYDHQSKSTSLVVCLQAAYENLMPSVKWLLKYISYFPISCKIDYGIKSIIGEKGHFSGETEVYMAVGILNQFNFVESIKDSIGSSRINMLNPIRKFVNDKALDESRSEVEDLKMKVYSNLGMQTVVLYEYMLTDKLVHAMEMFELELQNFLIAFSDTVDSVFTDNIFTNNRNDFLKIITSFANGLQKFLSVRGYLQYGAYVSEHGAKAHIELQEFSQAVDMLAQNFSYSRQLEDLETTAIVFSQMQHYGEKLSRKPAQLLAIEGEVLQKEMPQLAIDKFLEAIDIYKDLLPSERNGTAIEGNIAGLLSMIGEVYGIILDNPRVAINYYLQGYEILKRIKDNANLYCTACNIGYCYNAVGDYKNSHLYYKESIVGFFSTGQQQRLSQTLSEFGRLWIKHSELDISFLGKEILYAGLIDIETRIRIIFKTHYQKSGLNSTPKLKNEIVFTLWSIIRIVSLSEHSYLLIEWANNFIKLFGNSDKHSPAIRYCWIFLHIARLTCIIGKDSEDRMLSHLKEMCYLTGHEIEHALYDPYEWLALWLKRKSIDGGATREKLLAEIKRLS